MNIVVNDPIGAFERIRDNFILYLKTAFWTQFPRLECEREAMFKKPGTLNQEPWIEPLPRYKTGKTLEDLQTDDLPAIAPTDLERFKSLARSGLVGSYPLYTHQIEMLQCAIAGKNAVVTAGTGSGKTESFLLPLFAYLAFESRNWSAPNNPLPYVNNWWSNEDWRTSCKNPSGRIVRSFRVPQRGHETRRSAVRALILYPMNALVEDQLTRLRRALDSFEARQWCANQINGNRIYFGRYTGNTPEPGHEQNKHGNPDRRRIERLARKLADLQRGAEAATKYARQKESDAKSDEEREAAREIPNFFPRLDGAEMRSRWDMQESPPDILITNYSMLSIMLMREVDSPIFNRTRAWLEQPGSVFHLIIDELHMYRGTSGTEVAYLLRLLLHRLGLSPSDPRLRILASSASLDPTNANSLSFLSDFFGCEWTPDQILTGVEKPNPMESDVRLESKSFASFAEAIQSGVDETISESSANLATLLDPNAVGPDPKATLCAAMEAKENAIAARMLGACVEDMRTRAVSLSDFASRVFVGNADKRVAQKAVKGLLIARGLCASRGMAKSLPSFRLHWFFRNVEGLWACVLPGCQCEGAYLDKNRPVGRLFPQNRIRCGNQDQQHRVLEVLYCEQCGAIFFGGSRLRSTVGGALEILSTDPEIEGLPDRQVAQFVNKRTYRDFAVFWPKGRSRLNNEMRSWQQPRISGNGRQIARWAPKYLAAISGRVTDIPDCDPVPVGSSIPGYLYLIPGVDNTDDEQAFSALPASCPNCAADYSYRIFRKSPVRSFRTGFSRVSQLLSKELFLQFA